MYLFSGDDSLFVGVCACVCELLFEVSQLFRLSCCLTVRCVCLRPQVSPLRLKRQIGRQRACRIPGTIAFCLSLSLFFCSLQMFSVPSQLVLYIFICTFTRFHKKTHKLCSETQASCLFRQHWHAHYVMAVPKG